MANRLPTNDDRSGASEPFQRTEDYAGGRLQARHGRINGWLLVVYLALIAWALYYGYTYWGGLGPGLDLSLGQDTLQR